MELLGERMTKSRIKKPSSKIKSKSVVLRTIKPAPKIGKIPASRIERAVKSVIASRKKKKK